MANEYRDTKALLFGLGGAVLALLFIWLPLCFLLSYGPQSTRNRALLIVGLIAFFLAYFLGAAIFRKSNRLPIITFSLRRLLLSVAVASVLISVNAMPEIQNYPSTSRISVVRETGYGWPSYYRLMREFEDGHKEEFFDAGGVVVNVILIGLTSLFVLAAFPDFEVAGSKMANNVGTGNPD